MASDGLKNKVFRSFDFSTSFSGYYSSAGFKVYAHSKKIFVLDSQEGREIACYPQVLGEKFETLNYKLAKMFVEFLDSEGLFSEKILMQHVLRASLGYKVYDALKDKGIEFVNSWSRPLYKYVSFRKHVQRELTMTYDDPPALPSGEYIVLKPDTEATGNTSLFVLDNLFKKCSSSSCKIKKVIFYGFISDRAVKVLEKYLRERGVEGVYYAIEDITPLAENGYDMPLYGLDESRYEKDGVKSKLAALVPEEVLDKMIDCYYPGMDQPGDWSERQVRLFDGKEWKNVDPKVHAQRSLNVLEKLREISKDQEWYDTVHETIYNKIKEDLLKILGVT
ncbi:MAG: hypothetical protein ACP5LX_01965 [Nitrososphaeria archaeon]|jgi:hypothetical protein